MGVRCSRGEIFLVGGVLLCALVIYGYPLFWLVVGAFKSNVEVFDPGRALPENVDWRYLVSVLSGDSLPFWRGLVNSLAVALGISVVSAFVSFAAAFAARGWGRSVRFFCVVGSLVLVSLPPQALGLGQFTWLRELGLLNSRWGVLLPALASGFGFLYFNYCLRRLPRELMEAALLDGASLRQQWLLALRLLRPSLFAFMFLQFVLWWNESFFSLLAIFDAKLKTLPLMMASLSVGDLRGPVAELLACALLSAFPPVFILLMCLRWVRSALQGFSNS